jgi:D-glycero-alpha-D-manno-heptose-7-phosphate kinase
MIIARAPLRVSLAGGGTDLPTYADRFGGLVVSTTINRYVYIILSDASAEQLQITNSDSSTILSRREHIFDGALQWDGDHRLPLEALQYFGIAGGCRIFITAEVPPGTGLGSSSTTAVALITALATWQDRVLSRGNVAELACQLEIERMGMPIGRQAQYAAAFGGLHVLTFEHGETQVSPCRVTEATYFGLQERLLLFFTGLRRRSSNVLAAQRDSVERNTAATLHNLHEIKALAHEMRAALEGGDLPAVGRLLDRSWQHKRQLAPGVTTAQIDGWYDVARAAGAEGGKILGAGGGGFLMLYAEPEQRRQVIQQMANCGLVWVDIEFERTGATAVLASPPGVAALAAY